MVPPLASKTSDIERLADVIALPIGHWDKDARLIFCNNPYLAWAGRTLEQLIGRSLVELYGPAAWDAARPAFESAFDGEITSYERLLRHPPHAGRWARIQVFPDTDATGAVASIFTIATDIHEDIVAREALIATRRRLDRFTENIPAPLTYLDRDCILRFVSKAWSTTVGIPAEEALGRHIGAVRGDNCWLEQQPYCARALAGETTHFSRLVHGLVDGPRWMRTSYVPDFDDAGAVVGVYTVTTDVHELTVAQERLRRSVEHDPLTDALSRQTMTDCIQCALALPNRRHALYFIDLDGFKAVNDERGHKAGDRLLAAVAAALRDAVRSEDAVSRFGGDEFLVLAGVRDEAGAAALGEHLCAAVATVARSTANTVSASIGYAIAPTDTNDPTQLLHHADEAMYAAKRRGKNRAVRWSPA